ncbi:MAG: AraC family transcriptional regulator [Ornithinimicrobium sp.]
MTRGTRGIPRIVFDEPGMPGAEQFEVFQEAGAPLFDTRPRGPLQEFGAAVTDFMVDDLIVSSTRIGALSMRAASRPQDGAGVEWVAMLVARAGRLWGEVGKHSVDISAGGVVILDLAHPFVLRTDGVELRWVSLPRTRLPASCGGEVIPPVVSWATPSAELQAIVAMVEHVWSRLPDAPSSSAGLLARELVETVSEALAPAPFEAMPSAMAAAMKRHIEEHLDDPNLGVPVLQAAFHCSRSSIYRLFEDEGGVHAYIRELRLQRCYEQLRDSAQPHRPISQIAIEWGFESPSHFHRLFTGMFGQPPSAVARQARAGQPSAREEEVTQTIDRLHQWLHVS